MGLQESKMKFLIALLSVALVSGAANPGHDDHGHIEYQQHDGPHCHDKKDQQCHKIPKEQEHEECYVDYEIVVDVTYIEECQYVTKTYCHEEQESRYHHSRIVGHDSRVVDEYHADHYGHDGYHKRSADAGEYGYYSVLSVKTRRSRSATSIPMRTLARSPGQLARRLLTPFSLRSVRKLSTLFVRKLTSSIITVSMLLGMSLMLLLDLLAFMKNTMGRAMGMDMVDMGAINIGDLLIHNCL